MVKLLGVWSLFCPGGQVARWPGGYWWQDGWIWWTEGCQCM